MMAGPAVVAILEHLAAARWLGFEPAHRSGSPDSLAIEAWLVALCLALQVGRSVLPVAAAGAHAQRNVVRGLVLGRKSGSACCFPWFMLPHAGLKCARAGAGSPLALRPGVGGRRPAPPAERGRVRPPGAALGNLRPRRGERSALYPRHPPQGAWFVFGALGADPAHPRGGAAADRCAPPRLEPGPARLRGRRKGLS